MPGFSIHGPDPGGPSNVNEMRRKHRWMFMTVGHQAVQRSLLILQKASRPHYVNEEAEMHHNQEQIYYAGKHRWEPISLTWYDGEQPIDSGQGIWDWLNAAIGIHQGNIPVQLPAIYKRDAMLRMVTGTGGVSEGWDLFGCWPKDINYEELDYTTSEIMVITLEMRYDRANRQPLNAGAAVEV